MKEIKIDKEFQALIPPLMQEEFKQLKENILADGCRDSLVLWNGILIDGHNRLKICSENKITFNTVEKNFDSRDDVIHWIIRNQFGRRNLLPFQRCELALKLKAIIQAKAKENMSAGGGDKKSGRQKSAHPIKTTKTRNELSKLAGVSHDTIKKASVIQEKATTEQLERVKTGGKGNSINAVYTEIKQQDEPPTKVCVYCNKELPNTEFRGGRSKCKSCCNADNRNSSTDFLGRKITITPEVKELSKLYSAQIEKDLYDSNRVVDYTINDLIEQLQSTKTTFIHNFKMSLAHHSTLLKDYENKQKIIAVLTDTETAIKKNIKELLL